MAAVLVVNLAVAAAVAVVLLLRLPVRRLAGPRVAYGLWLLVPLAILAVLVPARVVTVERAAPTVEMTASAAMPAAARMPAPVDIRPLLGVAWAAGALASLALLLRRQAQFAAAERAGRAGPAAVGVLRPRIVLPADFDARYSTRERQVILAHEATHIRRQDPRINAFVAVAACLAWFNPMVHLLGRFLRIDQELACDAEVVAAHPGARRSYAEAMLKTQLAARPLPLGCYWPSAAAHPLAARIARLSQDEPGWMRQTTGATAVLLLAVSTAAGVWLSRPPEEVMALRPPQPTQLLRAPADAPAPRPAPAAPAKAEPEALPEADPTPPASWAAAPAVEETPEGYKVYGVAERSRVAPGTAVRVRAEMIDAQGERLITDLTSYGSHTAFRTGHIERGASRYKLFTSVEQRGEVFEVSASLNRWFGPADSGRVAVAAGETGAITLPNGLVVKVTPTVRAETPEELLNARRFAERRNRGDWLAVAALDRRLLDCGRTGAIC